MATGPRGSVKAGRTPAPAPARRARTATSPVPAPARRAVTTDTARAPAAPGPTASGPAPSSTFMPTQAPSGPDVTERVRAVVGALAPLLGLDPERVPVTVRGGAGRPHGAARPDAVVFTGWLDPALPPGRSLIVHELAHLRQHRNSAGGTRAPDVTAAEAEAGGLAAAAREGRPLWVPRQVLPGGHVARDTGASGVAVATTAPTAVTLERDLEALAAQNHLDDIRVIADQLDPRRGAQSESTGENSLRALSALQFTVARALVRSLRSPIRLRLAGFRDEHHTKYPEGCVAVLSALTADELRLLPAPADRADGSGAAAALHGVDLGRLSTTARRALLGTLRRLPIEASHELEHGDRGALFSGLLRTPPDPGTDVAELAAALRDEEELAERRRTGSPPPGRAPQPSPAVTGAKPAPQPTVPGPGQPAARPEAEPGPEAAPRPEDAAGAAAAQVPRRAPRAVELHMPPPPSSPGPAQQQRLAKVGRGAGTAAALGRKLPTAPETVGAARGAVKEPPAETKARAGQKLADALGRPPPIPELVALADEIVRAIGERRPPVEEMTKSKAYEAAEDAGDTITASVGHETTRVQGSYDSLSPDPAGKPALTPAEIHPPGTQVADPGIAAQSAAQDPIPAEDLSLDADRDAMEAKAAQARMDRPSAQPLQGTPPFSDAAQGRAELAGLAAAGPAELAKQQAEAIAAAQADMADLQGKALEALTAARADTVSGIHIGQRGMVGHEEETRAAISAEALKHYNTARKGIEPVLGLPQKALGLWKTGLDRLSAEFTQHLARVQGWVDERHSGFGGWFLGKWDKWTGLPDWVPKEYDAAEKAFGDGVRELLLSIAQEVSSVLAAAEAIIQTERTQIDKLFQDLPDNLQEWADGERKRFQNQLDALSGQVTDARTTFVRDISQRAVSSVTDVQEKVEALREKARGVIGRILDAIDAFLDDPVKAIINGLLNLLNIPPKAFWALVDKIAAVIDQIADDPETFGNNLIEGIRQGFGLFFDHFPTHLREGFWNWLTSGLGSVGVQLPTDFSPGSLFAFVLQLMGLTWPNIREILVRHIGEKNVELIEKAWQLISQLIEKGPAGLVELLKDKLDPPTIIDTIVSAASDYAVTRVIKTVTVKVLELLNPASAVLEAIELIYRVLKWVFENAARIFTLIETVVDGIADVLAGNVGKLALAVEKALAGLIPPVIDFLAGWLGIDDLPEEIAGVIKKLQTVVLAAADQVIGALAERAKALLASLGLGEQPKPGGAQDEELGTTIRFTAAGETHKLYVETSGSTAHLMVASVPEQVLTKIDGWRAKIAANQPANEDERAKASGLLDKLGPIAAGADTEAANLAKEFLAAKAEGGQGHAPPSDDALENRERAITVLLHDLFTIFGEQVDVTELLAKMAKFVPERGRQRQTQTYERWMERLVTFTIGDEASARRLWPDGVLAGTNTGGLEFVARQETHRRLLPYFTTAPGKRDVDTDTFDEYTFVTTTAPHTVRLDFRSQLGKPVVARLKERGLENLAAAFEAKEIDDIYRNRLGKRIGEVSFEPDSPGGGRLVLPTEHIPDHTKFRPLDIKTVEAGDVRTTTYHTVVGQQFTIVTDRTKGLEVRAGGIGLRLMSGRGVTEDSPWFTSGQGFNRAHLIANEFGGSGFAEGENLATTSARYNQETMRYAELRIGADIRNYARRYQRDPADVVFDLDVTIRFGELRDPTLLAMIKQHPDFPAAKAGTDLDAEIRRKIDAGEVHENLRRVVSTNYTWVARLPTLPGQPAAPEKTGELPIGPDLWLLIEG